MAEDAAATGHAHLAERYRRRTAEFEKESATIQRVLSGAPAPEPWIVEMEAAD